MTIFLDMDGVLADFDRAAAALLRMPPADFEARHGTRELWRALRRDREFYATLPPMADARELWEGVRALARAEPVILTGVPRWPDAADQKRRWAAHHFPGGSVITTSAREKSDHCQPGDVLIDDRPKYSPQWEAKGGVFIVHRSASQSLAQLQHVLELRPGEKA